MTQRVKNSVLILVQPGLPNLFDPTVDPNSVVHDCWVRWPAQALPPNGNRLLTLTTGLTWAGARDNQFASVGTRDWKSSAFDSLRSRGYFREREKTWSHGELLALTNGHGETSRDALLLALDGASPLVHPVKFDEPWPVGKTLVIDATRGDDIRKVMSKTRGRVLVIEYPPPEGQKWSRAWKKGEGWPEGLPTDPTLKIPGLIDAGSVGKLLRTPTEMTWSASPSAWTGANRWFSFVQSNRLSLFAFLGIFAMGIGLAAVYAIGQEKRNVFLAASLRSLTLLPSSIVAGSLVAQIAGLSGIGVWTIVVWAALSGLAASINLLISKAGWRPDMLGYGLVGLLSLLLCDPRFSLYGLVWGSGAVSVPPEPLGAMLALTSIVLGCFRPWRRVTRLVVLLTTLGLIAIGLALPVWWKEGTSPLFAAIWVLPAVGWIRERSGLFVLSLFVGSAVSFIAFRHGFAFLPNGLLREASEAGAINTFDLIHAAISPPVIGLSIFMGSVALFGSRFLGHQLRLAWREQDAARIAASSAIWCLLLAIAFPSLLETAVYALIGSIVVLLESLVRTADPMEDD